jgi:hypothetical protein
MENSTTSMKGTTTKRFIDARIMVETGPRIATNRSAAKR